MWARRYSFVSKHGLPQALQGHGIQPDLHPEHPKMGHLLIAVAREADNLLRRKRGG